ncbi:uncharacterized protein CC84DRAFT_1261782 [Paraphaeosphaeria sporulosa]|uniref:DUF6590 domain-containing protein n=1 Tax=Paraphaeosphaeria sporulosa TaxID=1460663 RepID=A0A177C6Y5_9PLEO|nr:uncharacterized protein CC84DRAFT_1261782 [Paraphaeosphaeria sporulosa]OAG03166.1 hypothetical protein CC84DRAFT_1261782 [Paraphaeosphaeria sporulosa]
MSQSSPSVWTWDANRQDYYYVTRDTLGNYIYHFQKEQAPVEADPRTPYPHVNIDFRPRTDEETLPELAPAAVKSHPDFIKGNPQAGWLEQLDPSYRMRSGREARQFFRVGKVFAMLHIQAASATDLTALSANITVVQYGERAFSQIRRFVIVDSRRGFVYACPIFTYSKRGTLKPGCISSEHSVIHLYGSTPTMFEGERERGLDKEPICVNPADTSVRMDPASRLHYGKVYPIEMNVKVKDIGDVIPEQHSLLLRYYREEDGRSDSDHDGVQHVQEPPNYTYAQQDQNQTYAQQDQNQAAQSYSGSTSSTTYSTTYPATYLAAYPATYPATYHQAPQDYPPQQYPGRHYQGSYGYQ